LDSGHPAIAELARQLSPARAAAAPPPAAPPQPAPPLASAPAAGFAAAMDVPPMSEPGASETSFADIFRSEPVRPPQELAPEPAHDTEPAYELPADELSYSGLPSDD